MNDAPAVLPLFAGGEGRESQMVSVGLGAIPAKALSRVAPEFRLDHLAIAAPVPTRSART